MEKFYLDMTDEEFDKYYLGEPSAYRLHCREYNKDCTPNELREKAANMVCDYYGADSKYEWLMAEATRREIKRAREHMPEPVKTEFEWNNLTDPDLIWPCDYCEAVKLWPVCNDGDTPSSCNHCALKIMNYMRTHSTN